MACLRKRQRLVGRIFVFLAGVRCDAFCLVGVVVPRITGNNAPRARPRLLAATASAPGPLSTSKATSASAAPPASVSVCRHAALAIPTSKPGPPQQEITVEDVTARVQAFVAESGVSEGVVTVVSKHTTTAVTINEYETRLAADLRRWLSSLAPPDRRSVAAAADASVEYYHNDIHKRPDGDAERQRCLDNGWNVDDPDVLARWRAQEPINAHSHLLAVLLGATLSIPVSQGRLLLGQWQSILLVDLDGPRDRTLGVSVLGLAAVSDSSSDSSAASSESPASSSSVALP